MYLAIQDIQPLLQVSLQYILQSLPGYVIQANYLLLGPSPVQPGVQAGLHHLDIIP